MFSWSAVWSDLHVFIVHAFLPFVPVQKDGCDAAERWALHSHPALPLTSCVTSPSLFRSQYGGALTAYSVSQGGLRTSERVPRECPLETTHCFTRERGFYDSLLPLSEGREYSLGSGSVRSSSIPSWWPPNGRIKNGLNIIFCEDKKMWLVAAPRLPEVPDKKV